MSGDVLIVLLLALIVFLAFLVVYQQFAFTKGIRKELKQAGEKLEKILGTDSDEKLTVFTDHKELTELAAQINELLLDRQRMKAEYRRQKLASKKMLANISHDIKTPLTVILGYLEMMRLEQGKGAGAADARTGVAGAATPLRSRDLYASNFSTSTSYLFPLIVATYFIVFTSFR